MGVVFALAVLGTRTWTWLLMLRSFLGISRRLPWRLMAFLRHARERGVLRGSGGYYQFGHTLLQERLVASALAVKSPARRRKAWTAVALALAAVAADDTVRDGEIDVLVAGRLDLLASESRSDVLAGMKAAQDILEQELKVDFLHVDVRTSHDVSQPHDADIASLISRYVEDLGPAYRAVAPLYPTVVGFELSESLFREAGASVLGIQADDLDAILAHSADAQLTSWLTYDGSSLETHSLTDGVSAAECAALKESSVTYAPGRFDLRDVTDSVSALTAIANCGRADVLVDTVDLPVIQPTSSRFSALTLFRVEDVADFIRPNCAVRLGTGAEDDAMASCIAMVTAGRLTKGSLVNVKM